MLLQTGSRETIFRGPVQTSCKITELLQATPARKKDDISLQVTGEGYCWTREFGTQAANKERNLVGNRQGYDMQGQEGEEKPHQPISAKESRKKRTRVAWSACWKDYH